MTPLIPCIRLVALLGAQVTAVLVLGRLDGHLAVDWSDVGGWIAVTAPADVAVAALRYVGLAVAWWLLATTIVYLLARLTDLPATPVARLTLPAVRHTVERAVAAGAAASLLLVGTATALAEPVAPPPVVAPPESTGPRAADALVVSPAAGGLTVFRSPADALVVPPAAEGPTALRPQPDARGGSSSEERATEPRTSEHVVAPGEHLWAIAAAVVAMARGGAAGEVTPDAVAPYWRELVAANRDRLRSGDPDLIYPGERLVLPPL